MATIRLYEVPIVVPGALAAALVESLLYGAHVVLFCICAHILIKRRNRRQLVLLFATSAMFSVATVDVSLSFNMNLGHVPSTFSEQMMLDDATARLYPKNPLYVTNNFLADSLLLYRCYMVWGERRYFIMVPAALLIADTIWGYISIVTSTITLTNLFSPMFLWSVFAFNLVITAATAGRIWWMARSAYCLLGKQAAWRYRTAIAIIVESGAIYCISLLMMLVTPNKPYKLIFVAIAIRLLAIMPTLMIVRVELGRHSGESCVDVQPPVHSDNPRVYSSNGDSVPSDSTLSGSLSSPEKVRDIEAQEPRDVLNISRGPVA